MTETNAEQIEHIRGMQVSSFGGEIEDYELVLLLEQKLLAQEGFYKERVIESVKWLIEQAERVHELETIESGQMVMINSLRNKNKQLHELNQLNIKHGATVTHENMRLREALADIIECSDIETAVQEIARQALEQSK